MRLYLLEPSQADPSPSGEGAPEGRVRGMSQSDIGNVATRLDATSISAHRADPPSFELTISPHPPFGHLLPKEKGRLTRGGFTRYP